MLHTHMSLCYMLYVYIFLHNTDENWGKSNEDNTCFRLACLLRDTHTKELRARKGKIRNFTILP